MIGSNCPLQSKLNCEVLFAEKSFEVRWAIAGDSVVIQLLAKLGESHSIDSILKYT